MFYKCWHSETDEYESTVDYSGRLFNNSKKEKPRPSQNWHVALSCHLVLNGLFLS